MGFIWRPFEVEMKKPANTVLAGEEDICALNFVALRQKLLRLIGASPAAQQLGTSTLAVPLT